MTTKREWKQRYKQLKQDYAELHRKWIMGEKPTWHDRVRYTETPILNLITSDLPTRMVWGLSHPTEDES